MLLYAKDFQIYTLKSNFSYKILSMICQLHTISKLGCSMGSRFLPETWSSPITLSLKISAWTSAAHSHTQDQSLSILHKSLTSNSNWVDLYKISVGPYPFHLEWNPSSEAPHTLSPHPVQSHQALSMCCWAPDTPVLLKPSDHWMLARIEAWVLTGPSAMLFPALPKQAPCHPVCLSFLLPP